MKRYEFTVEIETDDVIGAKEQIAIALENIGKVTFPKIECKEECGRGADERINKLYYIKREIEDLSEEIKNIPEISGLNMSGMPKGTSVSDPIYNLIQKKEKLVERLNRKIEQYLDELIRIENIIDGIEDVEIRTIARMRFVQNMKWVDIGEEVNLDRTACYRKLKKYFDKKDWKQ